MLLWQAQQAGSARVPRATKRRTTPPLKHDAEWTEHIAPGGKRYYHNRVTKVSCHGSASSLQPRMSLQKVFVLGGLIAAHLCLLAVVCCPTVMGRFSIAGLPGEKGPHHAVCWRSPLLRFLQHIKA